MIVTGIEPLVKIAVESFAARKEKAFTTGPSLAGTGIRRNHSVCAATKRLETTLLN